MDLVETIDDVWIWDDDSEAPEPLNPELSRSSHDNSNDDNDSKSDDGSNDHDIQGGGGGEACEIGPFTKEANFIHAT